MSNHRRKYIETYVKTIESELHVGRARQFETLARMWRARAGESVDSLLQDRNAALAALSHADPEMRWVAIDILKSHWRAESEKGFAAICETMAESDANYNVRACAIRALASCFDGIDDVRIRGFFARFALDETEPDVVRIAAYVGLLVLRCQLREKWPKNPVRNFKVTDIDRDYVATFTDSTRQASRADRLAISLPGLSSEKLEKIRPFLEGSESFRAGKFLLALEQFNRAIELNPIDRSAIGMRGRTHLAMDKLQDAIVDFTKAIELSPNDADGYRARAKAFRAAGQIELAAADERCAADLGA